MKIVLTDDAGIEVTFVPGLPVDNVGASLEGAVASSPEETTLPESPTE